VIASPRRAILLLSIAASSLAAQQAAPREPPTRGSDPVLEARVRDVASKLRCPVCQGLSLQDSPSELSQEMKDVVREQLAAGKSEDEVVRYFVAKYGEWILLEPKASGFNIAVYALPVLILAGGALLVTVAVRRWTRAPAAESPANE
jgi:cytochrome c-type biogenesis protein CcmH